jgi:hypothetical protein
MAQYDDGKRGFGMADAIGLSDAWLLAQKMLAAGQLHFPAREPPENMLAVFAATYPPDQLEVALRSQLQTEDAERALINVIRSGALPLWIAPVEGLIAERLVAASGLNEFGRESLIAGCYRPFNDTENLVCGYPMFIKKRDWDQVVSNLGGTSQPEASARPQGTRPRRKPGPQRDPDWSDVISEVTRECINAGYKRPPLRGQKAAIQNMLLNLMAERNKDFSEDTARTYAKEVIAALPDKLT